MPSVRQHVIPGGWTECDVPVADRTFHLLMPADSDRLLEHLVDGPALEPHEADPFWARLWPAATTTAEAILRADWEPNQRVLEVGCGVGLVGLAALARNCDVTFSDRIPLAVSVALENARCNGFDRARGLVLDWSQPSDESYPIIVGSDLLYDAAVNVTLLDLLERVLAPGGCCWIGDPGRQRARTFIQSADQRGFAIRLRDHTGAEICTPQSGRFQLITLERRGSG